MFKPLSTAYSAELSQYLHTSQGLVSIRKGDFFPLFWKVWETSFKESTILSSFKATGISPPNPTPILNRFTNTQESRESSLSSLSESDWRKMDRIVRSAVRDQGSKDTQKLRQSLHHLSIQNELLKHEMDGIKQALSAKKKREKKGKALDLQQRKEYHGGAIFWSPRKVREARVRQSIKEQEDKEQQLQRAETAELRKAAKLYKEKIQREKRVAREEAKKVREKEKADKAAARTRQKEALNATKTLKSSQKGKRKASQPSLQSKKRQKRIVDAPDIREALEGTSAALTISTRRGRNVKLPDRYK
ncbi:hypothetical protein EJ04DRAFT_451419 [Polyplosphaeria fusca]|uniref:TolA, Membrane protein involved in colicin uptake n=1 Tax=Polyplosphaeria fusca TaxID=682080 RepID=A0A9P4QM41_9PLEO|nr:hypothetical protein EJ04DRAFT_451419 [Polyplosphaeria fusca]